MSVYKKFAEVYVRGQYQEYARYMLEVQSKSRFLGDKIE